MPQTASFTYEQPAQSYSYQPSYAAPQSSYAMPQQSSFTAYPQAQQYPSMGAMPQFQFYPSASPEQGGHAGAAKPAAHPSTSTSKTAKPHSSTSKAPPAKASNKKKKKGPCC